MTLKRRYKKIFYGSESKGSWLPTIAISAGKLKSIKVPVDGYFGALSQVVVKQISGTPVNYTVEVLTSSKPHHDASDALQERNYSDPPLVPIELFRVIPPQIASAGAAIEWRNAPGFPYFNADLETNNIGRIFLYLTIIPNNASGPTSWAAAIGVED
ncbi:MAG: hypothetical protein KatS3mg035_1799 [Bacteroidia bacterium]|nr:MAG: hypothetical protein KatS3mg035_1799 [Bacteroidia bacterium]